MAQSGNGKSGDNVAGSPQTGDVALIRLEGIGKSYGGVWVLRGATLSVAPGEVVALVGENGAGKTTLKNVVCGLVAPNEGAIIFRGRRYRGLSTNEARILGIAAIHQELSLFPNLTVAENIHIDALPTRFGIVDMKSALREAQRFISEILGSEINPREQVGRLSLGERQLVEIAKALNRASTMLILDEPTTSLSIPERKRLFEVVARLRERGYALIYITHFLEEVYELADRVIVLRDGQIVGRGTPSAIGPRQLENLMVGRELAEAHADLSSSYPSSTAASGSRKVVLRVRNLSDPALLRDVDFDVAVGEIVGLAGLVGSGRTEIAQSIFGIRNAVGQVEVDGSPFLNRTPALAKARGIAFVSEDRRADQAFPGRSIRENLTSTILNTLLAGPLGYLSPARQRGAALKLKEEYDVRYPSLEAPMVSLSGGNQQRSVIARWLAKRPVICALDEPTKGIDVGARADVHRLIARLAGEGMAVLLISSDLPELLALSHRVLVMHKGRLVGEIQRDGFDPMVVLRAMSTGRLE